jgi:cell shape-determining protein MreD
MITLILGIVMMIQFFIPHKFSQDFFEISRSWLIVMGVFAFILGLSSFVSHHTQKIRHKKEGWQYSPVALGAMLVMAVFGLIGLYPRVNWLPVIDTTATGQQVTVSFFRYMFDHLYNFMIVPLGATMFSILAFYIASAAYRSFRAKSLVSILLLASAFVIMLSIIFYNVLPLGNIGEWLLSVPNMAAKRGILLGVALGGLATSLKIILGIERGYLGGTK